MNQEEQDLESQQQIAAAFHGFQRSQQHWRRAVDLPVNSMPPKRLGDTRCQLHLSLILEEVAELADAMGLTGQAIRDAREAAIATTGKRFDMAGVADGLGDTHIVAMGMACEMGLQMAPVLFEIQRSNLSKRGGPLSEDGKRLKPETYSPPAIGKVLARQLWAAESEVEAAPPPQEEPHDGVAMPVEAEQAMDSDDQ